MMSTTQPAARRYHRRRSSDRKPTRAVWPGEGAPERVRIVQEPFRIVGAA
jgi:hypothetical protein